MKLRFGLQINAKVFYKLIVLLSVCVARYAQSALNKKFAIFSQYLKENLKNEVDFLPANKHEKFL